MDLHSAILLSITVMAIKQQNVFVSPCKGKSGSSAVMIQLSLPQKCSLSVHCCPPMLVMLLDRRMNRDRGRGAIQVPMVA